MKHRARTAIVGVALLVAACSGSGPGDEGPDVGGPVSGEVSFLVFGEPEELEAFRAVVDAFKEVEPDVTVELIEASDRDDLLARLGTSFSGGNPPDLFLMNYRFYGQFAARGVLEPIEPYVDASEVFQQDDFYAPAMDAFRFDGTLTCVPQNISSLVVYYNRDLFREVNLPDPEPGWTWNSMVNTAAFLTRDLDGDSFPDQYGLGVDPEIIRLAPFVWSNGGQLVDDPVHPTTFTLDTPEAQQALAAFLSLREPIGVIPDEVAVESEDITSRFMNGRLAMIMSSRRDTPAFRTITGFDWDVAPLPIFKQQAGILHSDAYCMTRQSGNKAAAWRFMEFALGPQGQRITARSGRTVPSLKSVATSDAFLDPDAKPAHSEVFLDGIPYIRAVPSISTWPEIEDAANAILEQAMYEGIGGPRVVAQRIIEETKPLFARAEE